MAVSFYCGSPGSGKSYHVVKEVIIPSLLEGRHVLTNLPLEVETIEKTYPELWDLVESGLLEKIEDKDIKDIHLQVDNKSYAGWLIVIDEVHKFWPSFNSLKDEALRSWLSEHRHKFQDLVLITQEYGNVSKFVRSMTEKRYQFEKNEDKGFKKSYMQDYYIGSSRKRSTREVHLYDKAFFKLYQSHDRGLWGRGFMEKRVGKKVNLLAKPMLILFAGVSVIGFTGYQFISDLMKEDSPPDKVASVPNEAQAVSVLSSNEELSSPGSNVFGAVSKDINQDFLLASEKSKGSGLEMDSSKSSFSPSDFDQVDWCLNTARSYAGVGAVKRKTGTTVKFSNGREATLKGAHKVVGVIGVGSKEIYLLKPLAGPLVKGTIERSTYTVNQKICL